MNVWEYLWWIYKLSEVFEVPVWNLESCFLAGPWYHFAAISVCMVHKASCNKTYLLLSSDMNQTKFILHFQSVPGVPTQLGLLSMNFQGLWYTCLLNFAPSLTIYMDNFCPIVHNLCFSFNTHSSCSTSKNSSLHAIFAQMNETHRTRNKY